MSKFKLFDRVRCGHDTGLIIGRDVSKVYSVRNRQGEQVWASYPRYIVAFDDYTSQPMSESSLTAPDDYKCEDCYDSGELTTGESCQECCEHAEHDHGICLDCSKDCMDDLVSAAEYACEGER